LQTESKKLVSVVGGPDISTPFNFVQPVSQPPRVPRDKTLAAPICHCKPKKRVRARGWRVGFRIECTVPYTKQPFPERAILDCNDLHCMLMYSHPSHADPVDPPTGPVPAALSLALFGGQNRVFTTSLYYHRHPFSHPHTANSHRHAQSGSPVADRASRTSGQHALGKYIVRRPRE